MLFVHNDPEAQVSERTKHLQIAARKSHVVLVSHKRRKTEFVEGFDSECASTSQFRSEVAGPRQNAEYE